MRTKIRFALAALTAAALGLQPAFAQQPEAELKKAQEQLEKLLKELKDKEAKKAETPKPPAPPAPPKPTIAWAQLHNPGGDAAATLKSLVVSKDPKVAALAKELLEQLNKSAPKVVEGKPIELHLELAKPAAGANTFEFKAVPAEFFKATPATPATTEFKFLPLHDGPTPGEKVERRVVVVEGKPVEGRVVEGGRIVVVGEKLAEPVRTVTVTASAPAAGTSSLKLSADGKTAALLSADGTISIFDVATGKEIMKFAGKK